MHHRTDLCPYTVANRGPPQLQAQINTRNLNLNLRTRPIDIRNFQPMKTWSKLTRNGLPVEDRIIFDREASGYVLGKHNKLKVRSRLDKDDEALKNVHSTQLQIQALEKHMQAYDIDEPFTILVPDDLERSPNVSTETFNLFSDYPKISPDMVANSNAFRNMWVNHDYIASDLDLTYNLIKKNTDEELFQLCIEDYDTYHPVQQGGSLMFSLIIEKIHNASEQHMEHLKDRVEHLSIKDIEGEDVDQVVGLLNSVYKLFVGCSTRTISKIPAKWEQTLLKIFQTTSVNEFNETFKAVLTEAQREADMQGLQPILPSHKELTTLANKTYARLKQTDQWNMSSHKKSRAYHSAARVGSQPGGYTSSTGWTIRCFNCQEDGHGVNDCPHPRNEATIKRQHEAFLKAKQARNATAGRGRGRGGGFGRGNGNGARYAPMPRRKTEDGKPWILNKNKVYVLDQRKVQKKTKPHQQQQALAALADQIQARTGASTVPPDTPARPPRASGSTSSPTAPGHVYTAGRDINVPAHAVQDLIRSLL